MAYGPDEAGRALTSIARGEASFDVRAAVEGHLLEVLRTGDFEGVARFLAAVPGFSLERAAEGSAAEETFRLESADGERLVVEAFLTEDVASINVTPEAGGDAPRPDPRHEAFYRIWEHLVHGGEAPLQSLEPLRRAVLLIATLEAEVMNGGFGQYLSNTDGAFVDPTLECLREVGAPATAALLEKAAALRATGESFTDAWDERPGAFGALDDEFLEAAEDLAGLTMDRYGTEGME